VAWKRARASQRHRAGDDPGRKRPLAGLEPAGLRDLSGQQVGHGGFLAIDVPDDGLSLEDNERMLLSRALEKTNGNQTQAARLLRVTRDTLRYKMKKFSLK